LARVAATELRGIAEQAPDIAVELRHRTRWRPKSRI
jgi:hypothetical protein